MRLTLNNLTYDIDPKKTYTLCQQYDEIQCECNDCQNYYIQISKLPENAVRFFDRLGIDLLKCIELWCYFADKETKTSHYTGYFLLNGTFISGDEKVNDKDWQSYKYDSYTFRLRYEFLLTGELILSFEVDFPMLIHN